MSNKPDVAALTDEQVERMLDNAATASQAREMLRDDRDEETPLREAVRLNVLLPAYAAGRASLQANVPAPDEEQLVTNQGVDVAVSGGPALKTRPADCVQAAAALQSQQERIAELEKKYAPGMDPKDDPL